MNHKTNSPVGNEEEGGAGYSSGGPVNNQGSAESHAGGGEQVSIMMAACQQGLPHDVLLYIKRKVGTT